MSQSDPNQPLYLTACGGKVSNPEQYPTALYKGERIIFCTQGCLKAFESDPDRFMAGDLDHSED